MKSFLGLSVCAALAAAPLAAERLPGAESAGVVKPKLVAEFDKLVAGKPFRLAVVADVKPGWHVNSHTPKEDYLIPTEVKVQPAAGVKLSPTVYPKHVEKKFAFSDQPLAVYEGVTVFTVPGSVDASAAAGPRTLTATLDYQPCNDRQCLPPTQIKTALTIEVAPAGTKQIPVNADYFPDAGSPSSAPPAGPAKTDAGPPALSPDAPALGSTALREKWAVQGVPTQMFLKPDGTQMATPIVGFVTAEQFLRHIEGDSSSKSSFAGRSLLGILGLVFAGGLALNLTPCVYPVIPITLGFFGRQSPARTGRTFGLALSYVLGMSVTYSALGVFAAISGALFGAWLQKPVVLIAIALVVVALALSMFGLFEIQAPHFITDRTGSKSGALGALTMGLFVGFVAAPCIGPFIVSLMAYVAEKQSVTLGFGLFFTLAMGLGLPYLVLGTATGALQKLPRSGDWMVAVRKVFGFALLSLAVYFLRPLLPGRVWEIALALPLIFGGIWFLFFEKTGMTVRWFRGVMVVVAFGLLVAGTVFALPQRHGPALAFERYSDAAVQAAKADRRPVMIDFYADWCLPCKELDHKTFTDPRVVEKMKGWVLLKADLTR
jgi:thiol:disulfide interchange protein DsbD